jgi:DNA-binding XRE family transcriptional regulator
VVAEIVERSPRLSRPDDLRHDLNVSRERMGRLMDVSAKTVERWESQHALPQGTSAHVRSRYAQLQAVRDLGLSVYTPEGFQEFLKTPLPVFGGRSALQMIEQDKTADALAALASDYEGLGY